jgi:pSer/pThr/pTyr-binding forkhead associated (FHA) protein
MARLVAHLNEGQTRVIELRLGVNRLGRTSANDIQLEHATISSTHCQLWIEDGELVIRDCESTNGTFVMGEPIQEARLSQGQSFRAGDIEFFVDNTEVAVEIPKFEPPMPKMPPIVIAGGGLLCPRHTHATATHQCTHCREVMCESCVSNLRRRGGKVLKLCPLCSHKVEVIGGDKKKKQTFLGMLQRTVKLPFLHANQSDE